MVGEGQAGPKKDVSEFETRATTYAMDPIQKFHYTIDVTGMHTQNVSQPISRSRSC
jgi:hypothetical protein